MKHLSRYLFRSTLSTFGITLLAGIGLFLIIDVFERIDSFLQHRPPLSLFISYFLYKLPFIITQIAPAVVLITTVLILTRLVRQREWMALQSCGVHPLRVLSPLYLFSFVVSLGVLFLQEGVIPYTQNRSERILKIQIENRADFNLYQRESVWYRDGNNFFHIGLLLPDQRILRQIEILSVNESFQVERKIDAVSARYTDVGWVLEDLWIRDYEGGRPTSVTHLDEAEGLIPQTPDDFKTVIQKPETMTRQQLRRFVERLEREGFNAIPYRTDLHARTSAPWSSLFITFVATPFILLFMSQAGIFTGIGFSFVLGFLYWFALGFFLSLGRSGAVPPALSAWMAQSIFVLVGGILSRRLF